MATEKAVGDEEWGQRWKTRAGAQAGGSPAGQSRDNRLAATHRKSSADTHEMPDHRGSRAVRCSLAGLGSGSLDLMTGEGGWGEGRRGGCWSTDANSLSPCVCPPRPLFRSVCPLWPPSLGVRVAVRSHWGEPGESTPVRKGASWPFTSGLAPRDSIRSDVLHDVLHQARSPRARGCAPRRQSVLPPAPCVLVSFTRHTLLRKVA